MSQEKNKLEQKKLLDGKLAYSAKEIVNAVEKAVLADGIYKTDTFEMNCLLMNVLENLNHFNKEEIQKAFSAINDSKLHKEERANV
tara:strand:+ start:73 stop:330 length:258 start_codon:yes stop_codon:yes gene_type:complete